MNSQHILNLWKTIYTVDFKIKRFTKLNRISPLQKLGLLEPSKTEHSTIKRTQNKLHDKSESTLYKYNFF